MSAAMRLMLITVRRGLSHGELDGSTFPPPPPSPPDLFFVVFVCSFPGFVWVAVSPSLGNSRCLRFSCDDDCTCVANSGVSHIEGMISSGPDIDDTTASIDSGCLSFPSSSSRGRRGLGLGVAGSTRFFCGSSSDELEGSTQDSPRIEPSFRRDGVVAIFDLSRINWKGGLLVKLEDRAKQGSNIPVSWQNQPNSQHRKGTGQKLAPAMHPTWM